jgi:colanic acid biosynthesis glycosyl transferase WcaI
MAIYLSNLGHEITVITTPPYYPWWQIQPGYHGEVYRKEEWNGLNIIRCPLFVPRRITSVGRLLHLLSFALSALPPIIFQKWKQPDLIFCLAPTLFSAPLAAYGRKRKTSNWLHIQDFEFDAATNLGLLNKNKLFRRAAEEWESKVYRRFGTISTISPAMTKNLERKGVVSQKIHLFSNWVNTDQIFPLSGNNRYREEIGVSSSDIVVLYAGSLGQKLGVETLIQAIRLVRSDKRIHLVICGEGPQKHQLETDALDCGNIHFLSVQPQESLNELLNMADIHVLPQKSGAANFVMPSKLLGMLASGRPVLAACTEGTDLFDIVKQVGLVISPQDPGKIAEMILKLAKDTHLREKLGQKGREYAITNFSTDRVLSDFNSKLELLTQK